MGRVKAPIYRVFGGAAKAKGSYYSAISPKVYGNNYRNYAGLPNSNTGRRTLEAETSLNNIDFSTLKPAAPLDGNMGRLVPELKVIDQGKVMYKNVYRSNY